MGTITGTGTNGGRVTTRRWEDGKVVEEDFALDEVSEHLGRDGTLVWVDLCEPDHAALRALAGELGLDPHAVEDAISSGERPKATRHAKHTFLTVYATELDADEDRGEPGSRESRLRTSRISAFVLPNGVITVRGSDHFDVAPVLERWNDDPELLRLGVGALVHGLLDTVVDGHFDTIQRLDDAIESLEDQLFDERGQTHAVQVRTYRLRKELVELRRVVLPMREVVNAVLRHRGELAERHTELDGFYDDLYDHVLRASEWTESLRDMITTIFETNLSLQDARLNTVMKKLTGWAAIIAVPTAVTGWFGQNVPYPGFAQPSGVLLSTTVILGGGGLLYAVFRRKGWI
ncbi:magnesium transporter CorA family protein [Humibacillus xanthopallidus]|uniref:Magnesium transporter n=1 Tax=Humibacillus xanthopallidus TaxID=412689 RepID=A0A543HJW8_9MICO|nr:magnesium transporter CorA family protein [Humibacillus xanthopallidus]TQM58607.1 magnesium transporter [Humibacillus xanthopallidus]